ncbi:MAG: hypothetical protein Q4F53_01565 [Nesterenkonia sp.]|uniref:hypothetical protein n=1 Tax=Nesterenkonia marinintestina TaxID=2979865 RepID=UPI0021BF9396|nr:hypothetical protein [Nesterenkonia sp. GX14115]MDO5492284.1 hypothetical protein [Nesterenkonia sp.]
MEHDHSRSAAGTCSFRLMPFDRLVEGPSQVALQSIGPSAVSVTYTWNHPDDGPQHGGLLIGAPDDDGTVEAAWFDTWHHQPALMRLHGTHTDAGISLSGTYAEEWGWLIALDLSADGAAPSGMTMSNVIPESALATAPPDSPPVTAGPYEVMVAAWSS